MKNRLPSLAAKLFLLVSLLMPGFTRAQTAGATTQEIFKRYSEHVVKIEVVESGSAAKASIGTGFYAGAAGDIVTNYHVISKVIHTPDRYRIETIDATGQPAQASVLGVDVVYDLAVLRTGRRPAKFLALASGELEQGTRLYSLGHPRDLGITIVEGTYNGLLKHTLYPKVHFTGSLNPGMSGGPALTHAGRVVGVNVATEGEQISYLVPAERVLALLKRTADVGSVPAQPFLAEVGRQIHANQARYLEGLFSPKTPSADIGPYSVPTNPAPFFRCWADALRRKELPYVAVTHDCSTDDYLFVSSEQSSGIVRFYHQMLSTQELNPAQFFTLYSSQVQAGNMAVFGSEEEVTPFRCQTRNVRTQAGKMKAILCARQYVKLPGLYDAVFRVGALGARNAGLVSTLNLSGASFDNVQRLTRRYMERIQWRR